MTMGFGCTKDYENVYFQARKKAAMYNDRLYSREGAAEQLGLSSSTLADYELGITKVVPVDKVMLMADLYHAPELKQHYCKNECPIGRELPIATVASGLELSVLHFIKQFTPKNIDKIKDMFLEITEDGVVDSYEIEDLKDIVKKLDDMAMVISETRLMCQKVIDHG